MGDYNRFSRPDVNAEMLRLVTPVRREYSERPLTEGELRAIKGYELERRMRQLAISEAERARTETRPSRSFGVLSALAAKAAANIDPEMEDRARALFAARKVMGASPDYSMMYEGYMQPEGHPATGPLARQSTPPAAPAMVTPAAAAPAAVTPTQAAPSMVGAMYAPGMGMEPGGGPDDVAIRAARAAVQRSTSAPNGSPAPALPPQRPDSPAPLPPQRPTSAVQEAWARYNETGSPADFIRASNLMRDNAPQAEARGGSIKAKGEPKPDPVHKALEIIHHLLIHGR
jgi:hypothetical protein